MQAIAIANSCIQLKRQPLNETACSLKKCSNGQSDYFSMFLFFWKRNVNAHADFVERTPEA